MNYNSFYNKPTLNHKELIGDNKASDIGGMTEEDMEELLETDLTPYYSKDEIDDLFSRSFVYREKSGSIVTFDCPSTSQSIPELTVGIEATQSGSGDPSPTNVRPISGWSAVNVYVNNATDDTLKNIIANVTRGTYGFVDLGTLNWTAGNEYGGSLVSGGIPTSKKNVAFLMSDSNYNIYSNYATYVNGDRPKMVNIPDALYVASDDLINKTSTEVKAYFSGVYALFELATPTTPSITAEQYSAIMTAFNLNGTTYTTTLKDGQGNPMECYGGQLTNENGVQTLTVTHGYIASYNGEALPSTWISDRDVYAEGTTPTTGAEVVYALATSQQITQDTLSITSIAGINNIWCDSGDITVKALDRIIQG